MSVDAQHPDDDQQKPELETKPVLSDSIPPRKPPVLTTTEMPFPDDHHDEIRGEPDLHRLGYNTQTITVKKSKEKVCRKERTLAKIARLTRETFELIAYQLGIGD